MQPAPRSIVEKRRLEILPEPSRVGDRFVRHGCILRRIDGADRHDTALWYELPVELPRLAPDDTEPFLIAAIMDAMAEDRDIHVQGTVGFQLLSNLHEFMVAWSRWLPERFHVVEVTADSIRTSTEPSGIPHDSAVAAFSGGIDATCTVYRHSHRLEGHRSRRIAACVLVQGFDIALEHDEKFAWSLGIAQTTMESIGVSVLPLRTNFREAIRTHWDHVHGAALVSALQFFKPIARSCLIGSSKPYNDIVFPYGSNPLTDALLSSDSMQVLHDGARFDRLEKTAIVSQWPEGTRNLRVCWNGGQIEANCGKCEKCIRTKLGFLALGKPYAPSLGAPPTSWDILNMVFASHAILVDFRQILATCRKSGVRDSWVRALRLRVEHHRFFVFLFHWKWKLRQRRGKS